MSTLNSQPVLYSKDDEIDLFELAQKLYQEKQSIIVSTLIVGLISVIAAYTLPRTYESTAIIAPASNFQLMPINTASNYIKSTNGFELTVTPESAFEKFEKILTSPITSRYTFQQSRLAQSQNNENSLSRYDAFKNNLNISREKNAPAPRLIISYKADTPEESSRIINDHLLRFTQQQLASEYAKNRTALIKNEQLSLENNIRQIENNFQANNQLRITELREALAQAKAAGIEDIRDTEINGAILSNASYLMGVSLLTSRIQLIEKRGAAYRYFTAPSDGDTEKPYIRGVSEKVFQLNQLKEFSTDYSNLQPVMIEQSAFLPVSPIKPKKSLIVALGVILGGMLGIFIALVRIAIQSRKEKEILMSKTTLTFESQSTHV